MTLSVMSHAVMSTPGCPLSASATSSWNLRTLSAKKWPSGSCAGGDSAAPPNPSPYSLPHSMRVGGRLVLLVLNHLARDDGIPVGSMALRLLLLLVVVLVLPA